MIWRNDYCLVQILSALTVVTSSYRYPTFLSKMMALGINETVNPCDNFYEHVCDNWASNYPRPYYHSIWSPDIITIDYLISKIIEVLENPDLDSNHPQVYKEKQFYYSCMDTGISVEESRILSRKIVEESEQARPRWQDVAEYYATKIGEVSLFHITLNSQDQLVVPDSTLNENIADIQGIKLAYKAMRRYFREHPEAVGKNSFEHFQNFDNDQIFFVSFANRYCEALKSAVEIKTHAPNEVRVIGSLQNMKEFRESFACQAGTFMNPTKKCDFWESTCN